MTTPTIYETSQDPSYFNMWCVRPVGGKDFNLTLHFDSEEDANHAIKVLEAWERGEK